MPQTRLCPICKRPLDAHESALRFRPFCSKRCADVDLGRWLKGAYAIPAAAEPEDEAAETREGEMGGDDETPPVRH